MARRLSSRTSSLSAVAPCARAATFGGFEQRAADPGAAGRDRDRIEPRLAAVRPATARRSSRPRTPASSATSTRGAGAADQAAKALREIRSWSKAASSRPPRGRRDQLREPGGLSGDMRTGKTSVEGRSGLVKRSCRAAVTPGYRARNRSSIWAELWQFARGSTALSRRSFRPAEKSVSWRQFAVCDVVAQTMPAPASSLPVGLPADIEQPLLRQGADDGAAPALVQPVDGDRTSALLPYRCPSPSPRPRPSRRSRRGCRPRPRRPAGPPDLSSPGSRRPPSKLEALAVRSGATSVSPSRFDSQPCRWFLSAPPTSTACDCSAA